MFNKYIFKKQVFGMATLVRMTSKVIYFKISDMVGKFN